MSKKLKVFLGICYLSILFLFLYFIFSKIEISRLGDFLYYKELQTNLEIFVGKDLFVNLFLFSIFAIIWVTLLGFGSPLLIVSGILFGKWIGTFISVIAISFGALILYSITSFFFEEYVQKILKNKFSKYINLFKKNEFYYYFIYRFVGGLGVPFFLQNTLPVIFNMKKFSYFLSSLLGFIPGFFIFNTIGAGLNKYVKDSENFSLIDLISNQEVYLPLVMFICLIIMSLLIKKKVFDAEH
ncbi:VTT domain-containing protein [Pelagibacteraceae bacterium]|jgi:uncharacterized membrane protein YdjX (TVP38/TMEM64 family)|nr:VTT domain-containing protein [Pelagibacteraceae bacterium]